MNYYQLYPQDEDAQTWLTSTTHSEPPYVRLRPRYLHLRCHKCRKFDHDAIFKEGFDESLYISSTADILGTTDGFYCFNEKAAELIRSKGFDGINLKKLSTTGWYAANITIRVKTDRAAYREQGPLCESCGRPRARSGLIQFLSRIEFPEMTGMFFAPLADRASISADRDMFLTQDILDALKEARIRGGMCERLLTLEEEVQFKEASSKRKPFKWPKGARVVL